MGSSRTSLTRSLASLIASHVHSWATEPGVLGQNVLEITRWVLSQVVTKTVSCPYLSTEAVNGKYKDWIFRLSFSISHNFSYVMAGLFVAVALRPANDKPDMEN